MKFNNIHEIRKPGKIVLIEDNQDHAELVLRSIKKTHQNIELIHLEDGEAALSFLSGFTESTYPLSELPVLILLDLRLPKIDGLEVLKQIKSDKSLKSIPVIVLSTSYSDKDIEFAYNYNANSYLIKPMHFADFSELIHLTSRYWLDLNKITI